MQNVTQIFQEIQKMKEGLRHMENKKERYNIQQELEKDRVGKVQK